MKPSSNVIVAATARLLTPLLALFAFALLAGWPAGEGVGFVSGLALGLLLALHGLTFGVTSSRIAFPVWFSRLLLALGAVAVCAGAGLSDFDYAAHLVEAGAFGVTVAVCALVVQAAFGRAPTLRDTEL